MENLYNGNHFDVKLIYVAFLVFTLLFTGLATDGCEKVGDLASFKTKLQGKVKSIRDALVEQYKKSCDKEIMNCTAKSYNLCDGTGQRKCFQNFPTSPLCFSNGMWLADQSGVRISNALSKGKLTDNARKFICASSLIQPTLQQISKSNQKQYTYAYIGSSSGVIRVSPSFRQQQNSTTSQCVDYDPRHRPWYVSAITGSKITVILFDISKTMTSLPPGARFSNSKLTLQIIMQTLTKFDQVGVVVFSKNANTVIFDKIVSATQQNKNQIQNYIQGLQPQQGYTNYTAAFQYGLGMLQNISTTCQDVVFLLLTDGYSENDQIVNTNFTYYNNYIQQKYKGIGRQISNFKLISFIYGVQSNINYTLVRYLTCAYQGIIFRMWDGIDYFTMIEKLINYFTFLSQGINKNQIQPNWSQFYLDAFGFGMIVSVTMPIVYNNQVIGVAGIDVLLSKFQQCGYDLNYIQNHLTHQPQCFNNSLQINQLLSLRCKQGNMTCQANQTCQYFNIKTPQQICDSNIQYSVFYDQVIDSTIDNERCCGITWSKFIAIMIGSSISLVVVIVVIILYAKGVFHKIYEMNQARILERGVSDEGSQSALLGNTLLVDPQKKYKRAEQSGIIIYREKQFCI